MELLKQVEEYKEFCKLLKFKPSSYEALKAFVTFKKATEKKGGEAR